MDNLVDNAMDNGGECRGQPQPSDSGLTAGQPKPRVNVRSRANAREGRSKQLQTGRPLAVRQRNE